MAGSPAVPGEPGSEEAGDDNPQEQTLSDGRTYREEEHYPFDDGQIYKYKQGQFIPVRKLSEGERYVSVDGEDRIWVGGQPWMRSDWMQQQGINQDYQQAHAEDWARESTTPDKYVAEYFARQREAAEQANRLQSLVERIKSGRSTLSGTPREQALLTQLERVIDETRSPGGVDPARQQALRNLVMGELGRTQHESMAELARTQQVADRWDKATRAAELVKKAADKGIDTLAQVTGPAGKSISRVYTVVSNVAGAASEGHATGNWVQAAVEASARIADKEIGDYLKTDKAKNLYKVVSGGTKGSWERGTEAYKKGESVLGAAAQGALEGIADGASAVAKDSLSGGKQMIYGAYEQTVKAGYQEALKGGSMEDVRTAMESKFVGAASDEALDYGVGAAVDGLLPPSGAVDSEVMARNQWDILRERNLEDSPEWIGEMADEWSSDFIGDAAKKELKGIVVSEAKDAVKGEGIAVEGMQGIYDRFQKWAG